MANYPQLDDCQGVWKLKEVNNAVMGGYWRQGGSRGIFAGGFVSPALSNVIQKVRESLEFFLFQGQFYTNTKLLPFIWQEGRGKGPKC